MVKDLRTKVETGNVDRVLDGDFDPFIKAFLMQKATAAAREGTAVPVPPKKSAGTT